MSANTVTIKVTLYEAEAMLSEIRTATDMAEANPGPYHPQHLAAKRGAQILAAAIAVAKTPRLTQRDAVAMAFGWDRSEVTEYQYGRHTRRGVKIFDAGDGYACAVKAGKSLPWGGLFGEWRKVDTIAGWEVWQTVQP